MLSFKDRFPVTRSISFRVPSLILIVLLVGIGIVVSYYLKSQNDTIIESKEIEIRQEAEILYTAIKNNMLAGEAPIAVELFRDFERGNFAAMIGLLRADGISAFSDNKTIQEVNRNLKEDVFKPKTLFPPVKKIDNADFIKSVGEISDLFVQHTSGDSKKIIIYKPLINQPKCSKCHGVNHVVRGVIMISTPVDNVYRMARNNIIFSVILYAIVVMILTLVLIIFLKRVIISRILTIGMAVKSVGRGDFDSRILIDSRDEIGELGAEINSMISGLKERFRLTKFVSRSTLTHVQNDEEISLGGEKKTLTVLFSDIRGFTGFSETRDPEVVLEMLNKIMNLQARLVVKYGGDIDKFVGDELMAVFEGEDMVYRALRASEKIRNEIKEINISEDVPVYVGIGINTGEMISGNMGSEERIDRTVIGDAVNIGSRLCSIAGKNTVVLSEYSYGYVEGRVIVNEHEPIKVKGKSEKVKIYTLKEIL